MIKAINKEDNSVVISSIMGIYCALSCLTAAFGLIFIELTDTFDIIFLSDSLNVDVDADEVVISSNEDIVVELKMLSWDGDVKASIPGGTKQKLALTEYGNYQLEIEGGDEDGKVLDIEYIKPHGSYTTIVFQAITW